MAGDIDGDKFPIIPEKGSDPSSHTTVNAANEIGTVLKPGDEFYDVIVHPDGSQTDLGKIVVKNPNKEVVEVPFDELARSTNQNKNPNEEQVGNQEVNVVEPKNNNIEYYDPTNDINNAAAALIFPKDENDGPGDFSTNSGGFDDGGDVFF